VYISHIWGEEPPARIEPKFCLVVDVRDAITWFKFGDDRLRGLGSAEGQILPFPIDFDGRPYNTHTTVWACDLLDLTGNLPASFLVQIIRRIVSYNTGQK